MNVRRALPKIHFDQTLYRKANTYVFANILICVLTWTQYTYWVRDIFIIYRRIVTSINRSAIRALWFLFQFVVKLQNGKPTISGSCFNVELNCKTGSQLVLLFENMGVRYLQYFIIQSRFIKTFLRKKFTVIFTYRTV